MKSTARTELPGPGLLTTGHRLVRAAALAGAVAPSSRRLAQAMARAAHGASALVELGAGSGPVTRALAQVYPELRLVVVELRKDLAVGLRSEFKTAEVYAAPAAAVLRSVAGLPDGTGIVSSLPFRSLPKALKHDTVGSVLDFLKQGHGRFMVQFTYYPGAPFRVPPGFSWHRVAFVALNLPPASVWVLRSEPGRVHVHRAGGAVGGGLSGGTRSRPANAAVVRGEELAGAACETAAEQTSGPAVDVPGWHAPMSHTLRR